MPPTIADGKDLPGAFLFLTVTPKGTFNGGKAWSVIAYDPDAKNNDTAQTLASKYQQGGKITLPYFENFTVPDSTQDKIANWKTGGDTYSKFD
jgi:hypothetical protein